MKESEDKSLKDQIINKMITSLRTNSNFCSEVVNKLESIKFNDVNEVKGALSLTDDENKET